MATLIISFWHLCLDNLPEGTFVHQRLSPVQAKDLIDSARRDGNIVGVTQDDLFAPPEADHRQTSHAELRRVLQTTYGIALEMDDFITTSPDDDGKVNSFANPLSLYEISDDNRLLVINCCYEFSDEIWGKEEPWSLGLVVSPSTVEFHLFIKTGKPKGQSKMDGDKKDEIN